MSKFSVANFCCLNEVDKKKVNGLDNRVVDSVVFGSIWFFWFCGFMFPLLPLSKSISLFCRCTTAIHTIRYSYVCHKFYMLFTYDYNCTHIENTVEVVVVLI